MAKKQIVKKMPSDARRNLAKLERGRAATKRVTKTLLKEDEDTDDAKLSKKDRLIRIYMSEGIGAAIECGIFKKTSKAIRIILKLVEQNERDTAKARRDVSRGR